MSAEREARAAAELYNRHGAWLTKDAEPATMVATIAAILREPSAVRGEELTDEQRALFVEFGERYIVWAKGITGSGHEAPGWQAMNAAREALRAALRRERGER